VDPPPRGDQQPPVGVQNAGGGWGGGGGGGGGGGDGGGGNDARRMPPPANPYRTQQANQPAVQDRPQSATISHNNDFNNLPNAGADGFVACNCEGRPPAVERKVVKEGENQGRMFFTCAKSRDDQCGFFCFSDSLNNGTVASAASSRSNGSFNRQGGGDPGRGLLTSDVVRILRWQRVSVFVLACYVCRQFPNATQINFLLI